jgi:V/A-type H+-transporting ATPase subunit I
MSVARVKRLQLLAHSEANSEMLASLQEEGLIHIEKTAVEDAGLESPAQDCSDLDHWLYKLDQAIAFLSQWREKSLADKLSGRKPEVRMQERDKALALDYKEVLAEVDRLESERVNLLNRIRFLEKEREVLLPLESLTLPIQEIADTETTQVRIGTVPTSRWPELESLTESEPLFVDVINRDKRHVSVVLLLWTRSSGDLDPVLKDLEFNPHFFSEVVKELAEAGDRPAAVISKLALQAEEARLELEASQETGRTLAAEKLDDLMRVHDVLHNEREKRISSGMQGRTTSVFVLEGWVREKDIPRLEARLEPFADSVECFLRDPEPGEEYPVDLINPKPGRPFELITRLYGLPQGGTIDPTLPLMPFFFLFVGLTVSEAGYGLLVFVLSLLFLKLAKPKGGLRQFLVLLSILGVSNIILGTLVGGWFGFPIRKLLLLDPLQDPVRFLLLALVLGFIQVWFGTFLNLYSRIRHKDWSQALTQAGWLLLLPGLVLYGITKQPHWGWLALAGTACIVLFSSPSRNPVARFFGGLYGLYGISGYLSDILSYSRLLALGLATSVIAMVVNTLCQTALGIPLLGWLLAGLIFVGGHLFNLGISFLGGFVHSMRLQFVEFFSKFFQSGGKPFKPFGLESRYIDFTS